MDPLSVAASVTSICTIAGQLISTISGFVDDVQNAPKEVRALNCDLAAFYSTFSRIRLAIEAPRHSKIPDGWRVEFDNLTAICLETIQQVKGIVDEAVITETMSTPTQVWKTVKITFKFKKLEVLRLRLVSQMAVLSISLEALDETRGQHIENRLEEIHKNVEDLITSRANIREILVVLDKNEESDQADYVLQDKTSRNQSQPLKNPIRPQVDDIQPTELGPNTKPDDDVNRPPGLSQEDQEAVDLLCSRDWEATQVSLQKIPDVSSKTQNRSWKRVNGSSLKIRLELNKVISLRILSGKGNVIWKFYLLNSSITQVEADKASKCLTGLKFQNCTMLSPKSEVQDMMDIIVSLEDSTAKAKLLAVVETVLRLSREAWILHTIAMSDISKDLNRSTELALLESAWREAMLSARHNEILPKESQHTYSTWKIRSVFNISNIVIMILLISYVVISSGQQDLSENLVKWKEMYSNCVKEYNLCAKEYNLCAKEYNLCAKERGADIDPEEYRKIGEFVGQGIGHGINLVYNGWWW